MCASHGGEPRHVRVARRLLVRGGFSVRDLACGAHLPMHEPSAVRLIARGERASALHNNCSGKHAGVLLACRLFGLAPNGYCDPSHPIQKRILLCVADFCGIEPRRIGLAVDGCNLPVFRVSLAALAAGYARLLANRTGKEDLSVWNARRRIVWSMAESPGMVGGLGRFTTELLVAGRGRWIGKEGAEGVYAIGLAARGEREKAVGIAFKIEDGSSRARDAVALAILDRLGRLPAAASRRLEIYRLPVVRNVAGREVGRIEAHVPLSVASRRL
jgi:L-asparaginase II